MSNKIDRKSGPANAICLKCGTTKEDSVTGYCINDHDDWLEQGDEPKRFSKAMKKFNVGLDELIGAIKNNIDLTHNINNTSRP